MRLIEAAVLTALLAASASASEVGIMKKQRGAVRLGGVVSHTAPRALAPYSAPSSGPRSSLSGSGGVVVTGGGSIGPAAAPA